MKWPFVGRQAALDDALSLVGSGTGIAVLGPAGVGKSRLLNELTDRVDRSGTTVVRISAMEATSGIALAPFTELLPMAPIQDLTVVLGMALRELRARASQRGLLLAVDDAHHLDGVSLGLLVQAVASDTATVALTARSGESMGAELVDLWTNGVIERLDLQPLTRPDARRLLEGTLGPVDGTLEKELWSLAKGNPLVMHELIEGAVGGTMRQNSEGVWTCHGPLAHSARLTDLVNSRLRVLPDDVREAMEVVAIGAPLPLAVLAEAVGDLTEALEGRGLIDEAMLAGGPAVIAAHPLYGEILKESLDPSRRRHANGRLAGAFVNVGTTALDPLRGAVWQRDSGVLTSPELAIQGAGAALARHDAALAEELIRTIPAGNPVAELVLGRALGYQQNFDQAESVFSALDVDDPNMRGEIASAQAQNLAFGLGRVDEARAMLSGAVDTVHDPQLRSRLRNEHAMISAIRGDFVDARRVTEDVLSDPSSDQVARSTAYVTLTIAQAMTGDCAALDSIIEDAVTTARSVQDHLPFAEDQTQVMRLVCLLNAGRLAEAIALGEEASTRPGRGNTFTATWLSALAMARDLIGRHDESAESATQAIELFAEADPFGLEPQARGLLSLQWGQQGDSDAARPLNGLILTAAAPRLTVWVDRGRAWSLVARGNVDGAVDTLLEGGRHAVVGEHLAWGILCWHDVVRLGHPGAVIDDLRALPPMPGAHLLDVMRAHAEALLTEDPIALGEGARRFCGFGAALLAAEAWAQLSSILEDRGEPQTGSRAALLSIACQMRCERPNTPALRARPTLVTKREADMAMAAASGRTSPEIAKSRFVSVRTVDNHLSSVYRKLGISGREELRSVLAPVHEMSMPGPSDE